MLLISVHVDIEQENDAGKTHTFSNFPTSAVDEEELDANDSSGLLEKKSPAVWKFEFYKELFNVDTYVVLSRVKGSLMPKPNAEFTRNYIGGHPDLYGPFWICATLVITIGICGNLTKLFNHLDDPDYHYSPEFHRLVIAVTIVYSYAFFMPLLVRGAFFFAKLESSSGYLDILCLYGYSLFVYIPISFLLLIPSGTVDWILVIIAASLSGAVVAISLWPLMRDGSKKSRLIILTFVILAHVAFSLSFRLYFFESIDLSGGGQVKNSTFAPALTSDSIISTTKV